MPALQKDWELNGNQKSLDTIVTAAHSLATRFDPRVNAIRSWDSFENKIMNITDQETNFLIIIDSMCSEYRGLQRKCILIPNRYGSAFLCWPPDIKPNID